MRSNTIAIGLALAGLAAAGFYIEGGTKLLVRAGLMKDARTQEGGSKPAAAGEVNPIPVTVARATRRTFTSSVLVTGSLVARDEILVAPEVEGLRVAALRVEEGARVKKGDILATLVANTLDAQLAEKDAGMARAVAAIAQARSQIVQAEAKLKELQAAYERAKPLNKSGYLAGATLDSRESAANTAAAQLVAARDGLTLAEAEKAQVGAQRADIVWRRSRTEVRSPVDGLISRRSARVGAIAAGMAEPLFRIVANGEIELDAEVTDAQIAQIKAGQKAQIEPAGANPVPGTVRLVAPEIDKATRLGRVRVAIGDGDSLHVGAFARGRIETGSGSGLGVPASAVAYGRDGASVQLVREGRVLTQRVETGLSAGEDVEIRSGLSDGDIVVARAGSFLREGDSVRALPPGERLSENGQRQVPPGERLSENGQRQVPPGERLSENGQRQVPPGERLSENGQRQVPPGERLGQGTPHGAEETSR